MGSRPRTVGQNAKIWFSNEFLGCPESSHQVSAKSVTGRKHPPWLSQKTTLKYRSSTMRCRSLFCLKHLRGRAVSGYITLSALSPSPVKCELGLQWLGFVCRQSFNLKSSTLHGRYQEMEDEKNDEPVGRLKLRSGRCREIRRLLKRQCDQTGWGLADILSQSLSRREVRL